MAPQQQQLQSSKLQAHLVLVLGGPQREALLLGAQGAQLRVHLLPLLLHACQLRLQGTPSSCELTQQATV